MKLKLVVVDLELSKRAKRVAAAMLVPMLVVAGGAIAYANVKHTWKDGDTLTATDLNGNFADLDTRTTMLEGKGSRAASATNTGSVAPNGTWTAIPGLSVDLTLAQSSLVQAVAAGVQRTIDTGATTQCEVIYRFVVDGTAKGDQYGQHTQVSNGAVNLHQGWSMADFNMLGAGAHTIAVEVHAGTSSQCHVCGEFDGSAQPHDGCTLNVVATPQ